MLLGGGVEMPRAAGREGAPHCRMPCQPFRQRTYNNGGWHINPAHQSRFSRCVKTAVGDMNHCQGQGHEPAHGHPR